MAAAAVQWSAAAGPQAIRGLLVCVVIVLCTPRYVPNPLSLSHTIAGGCRYPVSGPIVGYDVCRLMTFVSYDVCRLV